MPTKSPRRARVPLLAASRRRGRRGRSRARPGREPVLKQIKVPHRYYYREMYLPQLTSGPDVARLVAATGSELALLHAGLAVAHGAGLRPRAADHRRARLPLPARLVERRPLRGLRRLRQGRGRAARASTSQTGEQLAAHRGRRRQRGAALLARRHAAGVRLDGARGPLPSLRPAPARTAVPRARRSASAKTRTAACPATTTAASTTTSRPSWSPDGRELLYVSNHGRVWGTGGLWRMRAEPGAPETAGPPRGDVLEGAARLGARWKARRVQLLSGPAVEPALAHDLGRGRRALSADLRRLRRHLAPLEPRRAAHRLRLEREAATRRSGPSTCPEAARQKLGDPRTPAACGPTGDARPSWSRGRTGAKRPARVSVTGADGRAYAPDDALVHADDHFERAERPFEYTYFHTRGRSEPAACPRARRAVAGHPRPRVRARASRGRGEAGTAPRPWRLRPRAARRPRRRAAGAARTCTST